jgi:hypothetical protein
MSINGGDSKYIIVKPFENTIENDPNKKNAYLINAPGSYNVNLLDGGAGDSLELSALTDVTANVNTDEGDTIHLQGTGWQFTGTDASGQKIFKKGSSTVSVSGGGTVDYDGSGGAAGGPTPTPPNKQP